MRTWRGMLPPERPQRRARHGHRFPRPRLLQALAQRDRDGIRADRRVVDEDAPVDLGHVDAPLRAVAHEQRWPRRHPAECRDPSGEVVEACPRAGRASGSPSPRALATATALMCRLAASERRDAPRHSPVLRHASGLQRYLGEARLPDGRLRLHDVHRQLRAAPPTRSHAASRTATRVACAGAVGQPPLHEDADPAFEAEGELPRVARWWSRRRNRRERWISTSLTEPLGRDTGGEDVYCDLWPTRTQSQETIARRRRSTAKMFRSTLRRRVHRRRDVTVDAAPERALRVGLSRPMCAGPVLLRAYRWSQRRRRRVKDARCLVWLGDSVTTDATSPAGSVSSVARRRYLLRARDQAG